VRFELNYSKKQTEKIVQEKHQEKRMLKTSKKNQELTAKFR
jgi:hypothetical protein